MQSEPKNPLIVFTGGGTGGHVYPGLALIQEFRRLGYSNFLWIGSKYGIEGTIVKDQGINFVGVSSGKLRRYWDIRNFFDLFRIFWGFVQSFFLFVKSKPYFVFSKGGFVSVPPVYAAGILGVPIFSHDSDLDPGLATRLNLRFSKLVFTAYPESLKHFPTKSHKRVLSFGNPVRTELLQGDDQWIRNAFKVPQELPIVLVMGGSLGARQVNELVVGILELLAGKAFVLHQTGKGGFLRGNTQWYHSQEYFYEEMPQVLAGADVMITRAGAGALWEAAGVGLPLVLIPLREGSRGDQVRNARLFAQRGAALVLESEKPNPQDLWTLLEPLITQPQQRAALAQGVKTFEPAQASARICQSILNQLKESSIV